MFVLVLLTQQLDIETDVMVWIIGNGMFQTQFVDIGRRTIVLNKVIVIIIVCTCYLFPLGQRTPLGVPIADLRRL